MKEKGAPYWLLAAALLGAIDATFGAFATVGVMQAFGIGYLWNESKPLLGKYAFLVASICLLAGVLNASDAVQWVGRAVLVSLCLVSYRHSRRVERSSAEEQASDRVPRQLAYDSGQPRHWEVDPDEPRDFEDHSESQLSLFDDGSDSEDRLSTSAATRVPLRFRLIDTGLFSKRQAAQIDSIVSRVGDENTGLDLCIEQGLLTRMQAGFIVQREERELRVGRYKLLTELGRGSMGVVYKALDMDRNIDVALKLFSNRNRNLMMIRREMAVIQELLHPNIVMAFEVGDSDGRHFIAMEWLEGETMLSRVRRTGVFFRVDGASAEPWNRQGA